MTPETVMLWLSSSKPILAVALARLWEEGRLDLDDPIVRHVPEFAAHGKERITLRHALTHTSGFRMLSVGYPGSTWEEVIQRICEVRPEPRWTPGEKAGYHMESSWFILGEVIQRITGTPYRQHIREAVSSPLGMDDCWIGLPPERFTDHQESGRLAAFYDTREESQYGGEKELPITKEAYLTGTNPGGNGCGPMRQLARLYEMLLQKGTINGEPFLRSQTVEALTAVHRAGMLDHTFRHVLDWGLGLIINSQHYLEEGIAPYSYGRHASRRTFGHSGRNSSTAFADPVHGLVVALAVNGVPEDDRHTERFREVTEAIYEDLGLGTP
jgi:CubicO group peptidase (beta-lactamase class C family)